MPNDPDLHWIVYRHLDDDNFRDSARGEEGYINIVDSSYGGSFGPGSGLTMPIKFQVDGDGTDYKFSGGTLAPNEIVRDPGSDSVPPITLVSSEERPMFSKYSNQSPFEIGIRFF